MSGAGYWAALFAAGFVSVFFLSFQSRCVNSGHAWLFTANSVAIAIGQAFVWRAIAAPASGWTEIVVYAASGALGVNAAVHVHARLLRRDAARGTLRDLAQR